MIDWEDELFDAEMEELERQREEQEALDSFFDHDVDLNDI